MPVYKEILKGICNKQLLTSSFNEGGFGQFSHLRVVFSHLVEKINSHLETVLLAGSMFLFSLDSTHFAEA
ncbi:MAG: hypothetical protein B0A82_00875 [Alkalinema sp. CACIAM 70d]|nr:MAG: hypothetical protein B0A82_00875 [Alkalinema sp. CACIAM 70d]